MASYLAAITLSLAGLVAAQEQAYPTNYPLNNPINGNTGGSLSSNPTIANVDLTQHGSDWLWAAFAVMMASNLGVLVWGFSRPPGTRAFHWIGVAILTTASIAYFTMASDLGDTPVYVEFVRNKSTLYTGNTPNPYTRSIWYARYIDWVITTPLLLLELLLGTGLPLSDIVLTVFFDLAMIVGGLIGALVTSQYKWGYFAGACAAEIFITYMLLFPARKSAAALSSEAHKAYISSAIMLSALWFIYPVCWGISDGGNVISTDGEMVFYGVLDILAKPVFLFFHLWALSKVPYEAFQLQSGHYSAYANGSVVNEKRRGIMIPPSEARPSQATVTNP